MGTKKTAEQQVADLTKQMIALQERLAKVEAALASNAAQIKSRK